MPNLSAAAALSTDRRLLVPMQVEALAVADPDSITWTDLTPRYDLLDADEPATLGCWLRPSLFDAPPEPPGAGIHLHWALPAAFTRIEHKPGKQTDFRSVPNRWLVVRLWGKTPSRLEHRAWVIDSDYLAEDGTNSWLTVGGSPRRFDAGKRLGRALDLADYKERGGASPLRAVAPGNLAFAKFYPSCRDVFGFHDRDDDLQPASVYCYVVVGWFADPAADPLAGCRDKNEWLERMGRLGWSVPDGTNALPTRILCHGTIQGVRWPPPESERVLAFPKFEIAIGSSALDAIAAFVDQKTASQSAERDRLLGELQFAVLQDQPPTAKELYSDSFPERARLTALRARLHERMFTALPGGTRWEIDQPVADSEQAARREHPALLELPQELAELLRNLNRDQREYDDQQRRLSGLQRDLYAQWYKRRLLTRTSMEAGQRQARTKELDERIAELAALVEPLRQSIASLQAGIDSTASVLRGQFAQHPDPTLRGHVLVGRPMPRYWRANDPVLLMAGVPIPAIQNGVSPLACRTSGQTVAGLGVDDVPGYGAAYVDADDLKKNEARLTQELSAQGSPAIPSDFQELLSEALLTDPERAGLLARIAYRKQKNITPTEAQAKALAETLGNTQKRRSGENFYVGAQRATSGAARTAFDSALSATITAPSRWMPAFMVWDARYHARRGDAIECVLKPWRFDDGAVDYAPHEQAGGIGETAYQGYAPLSDTVGHGIAKGKEQFPWKAQYPEDGFIFDVLDGKSLVLQSLGGLTEALIQEDAALQLPPLKENSVEIDAPMSELIGEQYAVAPLPERLNDTPASFFPIRGGDLEITRLWLVDTFGRARRVIEKREDQDPNAPPPDVYISRNLAVPGSGDAIRVRLSPRLAQPSRLMFRWLSADADGQEFLGDRATQPICGWILPNRLDQSLLIYDATGKALGAVQSVIRRGGHDDRGIRWSELPPAALDPDLSGAAVSQLRRPRAEDIPNRHLLGFVNGLLDLADDQGRSRTPTFQDLLGLIADIAETDRRSPERQDLSVLVGRPLALARASLRLELLGPPALDQSWSRLAVPTRAGFTEVEFDVRLGDRRIGPDGLIGCFLSDNYRAMLLSQERAPGGRTDPYLRHRAQVPLTCNPAVPATLLTLLLDPRLGVHIISGILPSKLIDLPPELVSTALAKLEVPFLVAPVLGERRAGSPPTIPLPTTMPGVWSWTWRSAPGAAAQSVPIKSETAPERSLFATMALYEGWLALRQKGKDGE